MAINPLLSKDYAIFMKNAWKMFYPVHIELPKVANNSLGCLRNLIRFRLELFLYIWYILYRCLIFQLLVEYTAIWYCFPYRYWGCISLKRFQHTPLKNVLTKPFIHNRQSNMQEKSTFFTNGFSNDSSSASQNMHLKYLACWGIYDIDPFNNSFLFCRNPHMYFKKILRYTAILWGVGPNVDHYFDCSV